MSLAAEAKPGVVTVPVVCWMRHFSSIFVQASGFRPGSLPAFEMWAARLKGQRGWSSARPGSSSALARVERDERSRRSGALGPPPEEENGVLQVDVRGAPAAASHSLQHTAATPAWTASGPGPSAPCACPIMASSLAPEVDAGLAIIGVRVQRLGPDLQGSGLACTWTAGSSACVQIPRDQDSPRSRDVGGGAVVQATVPRTKGHKRLQDTKIAEKIDLKSSKFEDPDSLYIQVCAE